MNATVLVTGVTGFIGREVARCLIKRGRPLVALARGEGRERAADRVARALGLDPEGRVEVLEADLAERGCGLADHTAGWLRDRIETVIHCAGDTAFFPEEPKAFRAGHVDGPCELLERLHGGPLARWGHLSTAYVCGRRTGTIIESEADVGQAFRNPYERVKLESELAIRAVGSRLGVDTRVFRPSIVLGAAPETTGGGPSLLFFNLIRMAAALTGQADGRNRPVRVPLPPAGRFNVVPLEYVSAAIVTLAEHPDAAGQTFHLVVRDAPPNREMVRHITTRFGLAGVRLIDPRAESLDEPTPLENTIERMLAGYREYLEPDLRFDDGNVWRVLGATGIGRPTLAAEDFDRWIDQALRVAPDGRC